MGNFLKQDSSCDFYARLLLGRLEIENPPINPREIAQSLNIPVIEKEAEDRYDGCLLNYNGEMAIVINSSISYESRKRFTIAHELGHAEIPHHKGSEYKCLKTDIGFSIGQRQQEREANEFAVELLMPASFVSEEAKNNEIGLEVVKSIAEKCETSLTSSALRYIKYSPEAE